MATTISVTASRFNTLRNLVNKVLGLSTLSDPTYGYGESINSTSVTGNYDALGTAADKISPEEYERLYFDLLRARVHQVGTNGVTILPYPEGGFTTNPSADLIEESYINALETLAANLETDKFNIDVATQASVETLQASNGASIESSYNQSTRGSWNGTLTHIFDVSFINSVSRRHFFNAGGQIRLAAAVEYSGTQFKSRTWRDDINAMGVNSVSATRTFNNNSAGINTSIGNYDLNSSYRLLYRLSVGGSTYANNYYEVQGLSLNSSTVRIRVLFIDGSENSPTSYSTDEPVFGNFFSSATLLVPNGSTTIDGEVTDTVVYADNVVGTPISNL